MTSARVFARLFVPANAPYSCLVLALLFALPLAIPPATAQEYPARPIRILSGPGPDIIARIFGRKLTEAWGQQTLAESLPAAGGKAAMETLVKAKPDGYTLLNYTSGLAIAEAMNVVPTGTSGEVTAIAFATTLPFVLAVPGSSPANSLQELIALARARPGQLNYASGGNGTPPHLATELLKSMSKADIVHVPFKGVDQAVTALLGSQVQMLITTLSAVAAQAQAGKLRLLAVTTANRSRLAPAIPSFAESGFAGYDLSGWNGFIGPPGLPPALTRRINAEVQRALKDVEVQKQLTTLGLEPADQEYTPERFGEFIRGEAVKWTQLVRESGAKID